MTTGKNSVTVDAKAAEARLMRYIAIEGQSGREGAIAKAIAEDLAKLGVAKSAIRHDKAHKKIKEPAEVGNLFADLPGTIKGPRLLFSTHLDVVPICAGAKPKKKGSRIVPQGKTALGGDNRTGCAVLVTLVESLLARGLPHPPITLLFTVREESGLQGVRNLDPKDLKKAAMGFNVDGKTPADLITGAVGAEAFSARIHGKASHAGVAPEAGISSTMIAALALAEVRKGGWWGKVVKGKRRGTSNVGIFGGKDGTTAAGDATNVVTDYAYLRGETRSPDETFAAEITAAYRKAFEKALKSVKDAKGGVGELEFTGGAAYPSFDIPSNAPAVAHAKKAAASLGLKATTVFSNGGLDANWLVRHGVPTVTIGAGQHEIHTVNEYVEIPEFIEGCRLAVALATSA